MVLATASDVVSQWLYPRHCLGDDFVRRDTTGVALSTDSLWTRANAIPVEEAIIRLAHRRYIPELVQFAHHYPVEFERACAERPLLREIANFVSGHSTYLSGLETAVGCMREKDQKLSLGCYEFLSDGFRSLADDASIVDNALRACGLRPFLNGSLSVFVQRPFRLSPDIDFVLEKRLSGIEVSCVSDALRAVGATVLHQSQGYIGALMGGRGVTIDIEAGSAYRIPLSTPIDNRSIRTWGGLSLLTTDFIFGLKSQYRRFKDLVDLEFISNRRGAP